MPAARPQGLELVPVYALKQTQNRSVAFALYGEATNDESVLRVTEGQNNEERTTTPNPKTLNPKGPNSSTV